MKQVIEYFGNTLVTILVAWCLLGLFTGLTGSLREMAEASLELTTPQLAENQAFFDYQTMSEERE